MNVAEKKGNSSSRRLNSGNMSIAAVKIIKTAITHGMILS